MADFAAARTGEAAGFTDGERREVVVEDEALRLRATGEAVHVLGFLGRPEGGDGDVLGVAALEHRAAVHAGENADRGVERTDVLLAATVGADAALEDGLAVGLVLQVLEDDVEVDIGELALAELGEEGGLGFFLQHLDVVGRLLARGIGVDVAAHRLDLLGNLRGGAALGALERHVLQEVGDAVLLRQLVAGTGADIGAERDRLHPVHAFGDDGQAGGEAGQLDGVGHWAVPDHTDWGEI